MPKRCFRSHARQKQRDLSFVFWSLFAEANKKSVVRRLGRTTYEMFVRCIFGSKRCDRRDARRKVQLVRKRSARAMKVRGKSPEGGRPHLVAMVQLFALPLDGLRGKNETVQGKALPFSCVLEAINDQPRKGACARVSD